MSPRDGNAERILATLQRWPDLDDDALSRQSGVIPRQQVNIICRRLEKQGLLTRVIGLDRKIINRITNLKSPEIPPKPLHHQRTSVASVASGSAAGREPSECRLSIQAGDEDTLVVIPCSARKRDGAVPSCDSRTLLDELPYELSERLGAARAAVASVARLDESMLMPAWRRYAGTLYQNAQLGNGVDLDAKWSRNLLILSGGYGVVRAVDLIGSYDMAMDEKRWPSGLLQKVIEAYARSRQLRRVFAFASETTGYASILRRVNWRSAEVAEAFLLSPQTTTGGMVKAPRAIGQALRQIRSGGLDSCWRSSDGLRIVVHRLL